MPVPEACHALVDGEGWLNDEPGIGGAEEGWFGCASELDDDDEEEDDVEEGAGIERGSNFMKVCW